MTELARGDLRKMTAEGLTPVQYALPVGELAVPLNEHIGHHLRLEYLGEIHCIHCGRKTKKSYNQGYCFPCVRDLARCDQCIVQPERCHYHEGTCREPAWGETHCMIPHVVYLANTAGLKVGITRHTQVPTRWIDQGAIQALPVARVETRRQSGLLEVALARNVADKTNWRNLLKRDAEPVDLPAARERLGAAVRDELAALQSQFGLQALQWLPDAEEVRIGFPIENYPAKIVSMKFDRTPVIEGTLLGIKGQYLLFPQGALNIRSHGGYRVAVRAG